MASYTATPGVMSQVVDTETILLDVNSGTYFRLNETGSRVWSDIRAARTVEQIVAAMANDCDVPPELVRNDVEALLTRFVEQGLVTAT